ncbi:MAG: sigma-70 family RNA polymerase sigma factor [Deltaproteobacteria bacterium]|nr:sigma-70 family RNA polymerase sigma factor [Deltaproteobacteria bacterium]
MEDVLSHNPELLRGFRAGERRALEAVFMAYEDLVRCIAVKGFGTFTGFRSVADTDDAVAAVFEAAFDTRARLTYDGVTPYRHYLAGITRNVIRATCRRQGREVPVSELPDLVSDRAEDHPGRDLEAAEGSALLERFRSSLGDPRLIRVFEGYFARGLSEAALATELGMNRYRVRLLLARVRSSIQKFLRAEGLA